MEDFIDYYIEGVNIDSITPEELKECIKEMMVRAVTDVDFKFQEYIQVKSGFRNTRGA